MKFLPGVGFNQIEDISGKSVKDPYDRSFCWKLDITPTCKKDELLVPYSDSDLYCNVLVGADGENSTVAKQMGFERKVLQGSRAIGITANFQNNHTREENQIREFGLLSVYNQEFFSELNDKYGIDLENLVYYRGETHYFVMTAKTKR